MNVTPEDLDAAFGPDWTRPALFYAYEPALRFELGVGSHPLERFLSAFERAVAITTHLIGNVDDLTLAVTFFPDPDKQSVAELLHLCRGLRDCGLPLPNRQSLRDQAVDQEDETSRLLQMTAPIGEEHIRRALWAAVGQDLGIEPRVPGRLYLASISLGVLLHPYDDRGMDVVGVSADCIRSAFEQFHDWLLSYDLAKMTRAFG